MNHNMKALTLFALLLFVSTTVMAQRTIYRATGGTVHPYPAVSATLKLGNNPYTEFALVQLGGNFHRALYSLPNGDNNLPDGFNNLHGWEYALAPGDPRCPAMPCFFFIGQASGIDSVGKRTTMVVEYIWRTFTRAGKGGGTRLIFVSGYVEEIHR